MPGSPAPVEQRHRDQAWAMVDAPAATTLHRDGRHGLIAQALAEGERTERNQWLNQLGVKTVESAHLKLAQLLTLDERNAFLVQQLDDVYQQDQDDEAEADRSEQERSR